MARTRSWVNCPSCGHTVEFNNGPSLSYFGSPICTCPKCNNKYINPWVIELAVMPREWYKTHKRNYFIVIFLFLFPFLLYFFVTNFISKAGGISFIPAFFVSFILILIYLANTSNFAKTPGFDNSYDESAARLSDAEYKQFLTDSGYMKTIKRQLHK